MYGTFFGKKRHDNESHKAPFRYVVKKGETLSYIASKTSTSINKIIELNPHAFDESSRKHKVYPGQSLLVDEPDEVNLPPPPEAVDEGWGQMHIVQSHDTLKSISEEFNTTESAIRSDNRQFFPVGERGILFPGQMLIIRVVNTVDSETVDDYTNLEPPSRGFKYHRVRSSDTFDSICSKYGMTYEYMIRKNPVAFPVGKRVSLKVGSFIVVTDPEKDRFPEKCRVSEVVLTKQIHTVKPGENPEDIAVAYNMTIDELREYNRSHFPSGYRGSISPGLKLVVKKSSFKSINGTSKRQIQSPTRVEDF